MHQALQKLLDAPGKWVFFGGAGVSTESGIPDFRSTDGLYHQRYAHPPEKILSHSFFMDQTEAFYAFYREKMLPLSAQPNQAHLQLVQWEKAGKLQAIITQNIDGLHQKAGSQQVHELHGSIHRNYCLQCGHFYPAQQIADSTGIPHCSCGGIIKPDVVLYGENLEADVLEASTKAIQRADTLLVAGTSLSVYPAAGLVEYFQGDNLILINQDTTPMDAYASLIIRGKVGEVLGKLHL